MEKGEVAVVVVNEDNTSGEVPGPATSTSLDTLQFKHDFFEVSSQVLEELQLRRQEDGEHKKRVEEILKDKYELEKKLEDCCMANSQLVEKHRTEQEEMRHCYEEKMRTLQEEKAKASINNSCEDGQVSRLKDEIRALHLHKYNLEKTVSEQEHKLHLQLSSHEQFLSLVRQLEEKCTTLSQQVVEANEHLDLLSNNVNEAITINVKLERQQKHHNCVVFSYQDELATTKKELMRLTTKLSIDQQANRMANGNNSNTRDLEHQLKMQQDMTALLEKQMEELQKENTSIASALKESSSLLERQADSYEETKSNNASLQEQLTATRNNSEALTIELAEKSNELVQLERKHHQEQEIHSKKFADMEQRLRALQSDFIALQQSYESLQCEKHQWLKEKAEHVNTMTNQTEKIALLEEQLNKLHNNLNPIPIISTNKSPDLIKKVDCVEAPEDDSKCVEDDSPSSKRICLSPSVTKLPSSLHDSPAMPMPSSSHDISVVSPQACSGDLPVKLHSSPQEHAVSPLHSSSKDFVSSPSSHDVPATPPKSNFSLHDASIPSPPNSHDLLATPPESFHDPSIITPNPVDSHDSSSQSHDPAVQSHSSPYNTTPACSNMCDASLPSSYITTLSSSSLPTATEQQDQLEFTDPTSDIINTQLNQHITDVQHFLKTDRLKRTKLPDTNTVQ